MSSFIHDDFLLQNLKARQLYHDFAKSLPIIDFHNHLPPDEILENKKFSNLTDIWLRGDHYKWRAMRTLGVSEENITGKASDIDKFQAWAKAVPFTIKNPLYHWTHLELKRYFNIDKLLDTDSADEIWAQTSELLQDEEFSSRHLLLRMNARVVCTTDDPVDSLDAHRQLSSSNKHGFVLYPTFRPDKAMQIDRPGIYREYLDKLAEASGVEINSWQALLEALRNRHDYFDSLGCRASDHGVEVPYAFEYTESEVTEIFLHALSGKEVSPAEVQKFRSAIMHEFAIMDHEKGWVFQMHFGAIRNNNSRMYDRLGPDTGFDSIGNFEVAGPLSKFLNRLDKEYRLPKTILYNLNPADNAIVSTMTGNFQSEGIKGKIQHGPAWWFHDQKEGMEEHLQTLSNMSLLSCFVGMVTDSRSFLSFPRHEYYRRVLCNMLGSDVENGFIPDDSAMLQNLIEKLCYKNALDYFNYSRLPQSVNYNH